MFRRRSALSQLRDKAHDGGEVPTDALKRRGPCVHSWLSNRCSVTTRLVAEAIADGIGVSVPFDLVGVDEALPELQPDVILLVVGGPTHAFSMSRPKTREDAMTQRGEDARSAGIGMREWLASIAGGGRPVAAAFDTRIDKPRVPGSAARAAEKRLRKLGFPLVMQAESFYVSGTLGPPRGRVGASPPMGRSIGSGGPGVPLTDNSQRQLQHAWKGEEGHHGDRDQEQSSEAG